MAIIRQDKTEDVVRRLEKLRDFLNTTEGMFKAAFPNTTTSIYDDGISAVSDAIDMLMPREIANEEWQAWKKSMRRDPLCFMWVGDRTVFWVLDSECIPESAYYTGQVVIFNGKPTEKQRDEVWKRGHSGGFEHG